jgi:tetratricopeptide (TPR) repeat protein
VQVVSRLSATASILERANYLLRGHARHTDGRIGLFVELSEAATGHVAWARSFKGSAAELFCENAAVIRALVTGVASGLMTREAERARGQPLPALASHTLLLAAIVLMHRLEPVDLEHARIMLEHLLERNRRHPAVLAWLAHWHMLNVQQDAQANRRTHVEIARQHANAALQADAQSPLALCLAGHVQVHLLGDLDTAAARYAQVLRQWPDDGLALLLQGELLALRGDGAGGLRLAERALQLCALDQLRPWYEQVTAQAALVAGDTARALQLAESAAAALPCGVAAHCTLALARAASGQVEAAARTVQALLRLRPDFSLRLYTEGCPGLPALTQRGVEALALAGVPTG